MISGGENVIAVPKKEKKKGGGEKEKHPSLKKGNPSKIYLGLRKTIILAYTHLTDYRKYSTVSIVQRRLRQLGMEIIVAKISEKNIQHLLH